MDRPFDRFAICCLQAHDRIRVDAEVGQHPIVRTRVFVTIEFARVGVRLLFGTVIESVAEAIASCAKP